MVIGICGAKNNRVFKGTSLLESLENYVVVDIETTGYSPDFDEIIELGALKIENNIVIAQFQTLIKPEEMIISEFITEKTGITNEMVKDAPSLYDVLGKYVNFIGDNIVIGHNVNFDINFLYDYCEGVLDIN